MLWQRLRRWGAFESWKDAADVAFKIVGAVAAFGALNLLTVRANVNSSTTCQDRIDEDRVTATYAESGQSIPSVVTDFIRSSNEGLGRGFYTTLAAAKFALAVSPSPCDGPFGLPVLGSLLGTSDDLFGPNMTDHEIRFATLAIIGARQVEVRVRATNVGRYDAVDVRFDSPDGYRQTAGSDDAFDLPPGEAQSATFEATPRAPDFVPDDFEPLWSATLAADVWGLIWKIAIPALLVLWLPFVIVGLMAHREG